MSGIDTTQHNTVCGIVVWPQMFVDDHNNIVYFPDYLNGIGILYVHYAGRRLVDFYLIIYDIKMMRKYIRMSISSKITNLRIVYLFILVIIIDSKLFSL